MNKRGAIPRNGSIITRADKVIAFIERFCVVPEGKLVGRPIKLLEFQKRFIRDVYDNPHGTAKGILSIARKNGKTALIACLVLAHLVGPEAILNSQIISGAMSKEQAAIVFKLALKMVQLSDRLSELVRPVPSVKTLIGIALNVEYKAISAEGSTAHGLSPIVAILDEVGQVKGPHSAFVDAVETAQGAHDNPLLLVISTQAAKDSDLLSLWIDDALAGHDVHTIVHLYAATPDCDLLDPIEHKRANPALGIFLNEQDLLRQAQKASRMPSAEPTFRNLKLNQRVETTSPFVTKATWMALAEEDEFDFASATAVYAAIDLASTTDLASLTITADDEDGNIREKTYLWTPAETLADRAKRDKAPYETWREQGHLRALPGNALPYDLLVGEMLDILLPLNLVGIAYDRWRIDVFRRALTLAEADHLPLMEFGQGFKDMAPAVDALETAILNKTLRHCNNPVLTMCMANVRVEKDSAENRKFTKAKSTGRIDGAVTLLMAIGLRERFKGQEDDFDDFVNRPIKG